MDIWFFHSLSPVWIFHWENTSGTTQGIALSAPTTMEMYLQDLQQPNIDEDAIVDHPTTMTNLHHDGLCVDTFTYLLRDDTAPSGDVTAVLTAVGAGHPMGLHHAHKHEFLYQFLPYPMRKQLYHGKSYPFTGVNVPRLTDVELGEVIVGLCRHLITHGRDKDVRTLCKKISTSLHTPMISWRSFSAQFIGTWSGWYTRNCCHRNQRMIGWSSGRGKEIPYPQYIRPQALPPISVIFGNYWGRQLLNLQKKTTEAERLRSKQPSLLLCYYNWTWRCQTLWLKFNDALSLL